MKKKIFIAVLNQGFIRTELTNIMTQLSQDDRYVLMATYPAEKPIANNRNTVVRKFLESDCDYLLMMDNDCPPNSIDRLIEMADYDKDIIGGLCFGYLKEMIVPFCMKKNEEGTYNIADVCEGGGVMECDAIGSGNMMIARRVLENIDFPFRNEYDKEGIKIKGLDFNFCARAKKKGYKVWCDTSLICSHWTTINLSVVWKTLQKQIEVIKTLNTKLEELTKKEDAIQ
jgi:GT2 family glycosyltransferase